MQYNRGIVVLLSFLNFDECIEFLVLNKPKIEFIRSPCTFFIIHVAIIFLLFHHIAARYFKLHFLYFIVFRSLYFRTLTCYKPHCMF